MIADTKESIKLKAKQASKDREFYYLLGMIEEYAAQLRRDNMIASDSFNRPRKELILDIKCYKENINNAFETLIDFLEEQK